MTETDHLFEKAEQLCEREGYAENGDTLVISCGTPVGISGTTNTMKITTVGESLTKGIPIHSGHSVERISGDVFNYTEFSDGENRTISIEEDLSEFQKGNIFFCKSSIRAAIHEILKL